MREEERQRGADRGGVQIGRREKRRRLYWRRRARTWASWPARGLAGGRRVARVVGIPLGVMSGYSMLADEVSAKGSRAWFGSSSPRSECENWGAHTRAKLDDWRCW